MGGIERIGAVDYLIVQTDPLLQKELGIKRFLVPYIDRFVLLADVKNRLVECSGAKGILEAS